VSFSASQEPMTSKANGTIAFLFIAAFHVKWRCC
jgi:hypothetical protein